MSENSSQTRNKTIHSVEQEKHGDEQQRRAPGQEHQSGQISVALRELKKTTPRRKNGRGPSVRPKYREAMYRPSSFLILPTSRGLPKSEKKGWTGCQRTFTQPLRVVQCSMYGRQTDARNYHGAR